MEPRYLDQYQKIRYFSCWRLETYEKKIDHAKELKIRIITEKEWNDILNS